MLRTSTAEIADRATPAPVNRAPSLSSERQRRVEAVARRADIEERRLRDVGGDAARIARR